MTSRARAAAIVLTLAAGIAGIGAAPASAKPKPPPPGLSITIDNASSTTKPDSDVNYKLTLANAGTDSVTAWIVASVPTYAKITDAGGGQVSGHNDTWKVTVGAGKKQTETLTAHIGTIPKSTYRVTALASVYLSKNTSKAPVIRSADSDAIPGMTEPNASHSTSTTSKAAHASSSMKMPVIVGIAGGIVIIAAAVVTLVLARRSRRLARRGRRRT
jgi:hypothetical protein